jgi:hypothetical protein
MRKEGQETMTKKYWGVTMLAGCFLLKGVAMIGQDTPTLAPLIQKRIAPNAVALQPEGFEPARNGRDEGRFLLASDNQSRLDEAALEQKNLVAGSESDKGERVEAELLTLTDQGFNPPEIKRPKGEVILCVDNFSGDEDVTFRLDRVAGDRMHESKFRHGKQDWNLRIKLTPGEYQLSVVEHPEWICHITITP